MIGVSVATLRNWEQGRRTPDGPALALLRVAARNLRIPVHREHSFRFNVNADSADAEHRFRSS